MDLNLLEENIVVKLHDIGFGNNFLDMRAKVQATKAKIDEQDYIKLKSFYETKETINRVKRQSMEWEKIFANYISDKGLIFIIYREHLELNKKTINSKSAKDLNKHFSKEYIQMANNSMKRCSTSLIFREMQIKITM